MRRDEVNDELKELAFDFFYWFSRFEFSLKENKFLKYERVGVSAEPGWDRFIERYSELFKHTEQTQLLLILDPKRQSIGVGSCVEWSKVDLNNCPSELCKVVRLLKTVRNNLFHGGKHSAEGWDEPDRTKQLLSNGKMILDQLIEMAGFEADYTRYY